MLAAAALCAACGPGDAAPPAPGPPPGVPFEDATERTGLAFVHDNGRTGRYYMPEIMGAGAGLFDMDGDGDLDLYLVQGGAIEGPRRGAGDRLFRNDLGVFAHGADGADGVRFTDVTAASGLGDGGYGMGVATGDADGDGRVDLYVTRFGRDALYLNRGDGRFEDATERAGVGDPRWTVPAAFFDMDGDGDLDLFVGSYVDFRLANHKDCFSATGLADYCGPHSYGDLPDRLFENAGDGTFRDVTAKSGLRSVRSKALGAIPSDFDGDGRIDLYVANDGVANQLWINRGGGRFEETALLAGCALNHEGMAEASMGVDAGDVDDDGDDDLFMTHLRGETNTLYLNRGDGTFEDRTIRFGLATASIPLTGFGTAWVDVDRDARLDLVAVNGAVTVEEHLVRDGDPFPFHQRNQLFLNVSDADGLRFEEHRAGDGDPLAVSEVSRGAAFGDIDNDGDTDVVVANNGGPARVLLNVSRADRSWLGLSLLERDGGPHALGASARVRLPDGRTLTRRARTAGSYASANDPRVLFGLGRLDGGTRLEVAVRWPGGAREAFGPLATDRYHVLVRGTGRPAGESR